MQSVSQAWKENQAQRVVGESFVEVSYKVTDPDAQADAAATDNGHVAFSNIAQTVDEIETLPHKFATLERDFWALDGTFELLPDRPPYGENGYIGSGLSGADGVFAMPPTITITFAAIHTPLIPGVTVTWGTAYHGEWADTVRVRAYLNANVRAEKTVRGNALLSTIVALDIENYNKITIEILKWCKPYRRARIETILVGIERVYAKSEIMDFKHSMTVDPLSATLPKAEVVFKINNVDGAYNPDNTEGAEKYLMERQEVKVRYGYKLGEAVEWVPAGTFYTSEWDAPQNGITATFTARDLLEFMGNPFVGRVAGSLYDLAEAALRQANLPLNTDGSIKWRLDNSLRTILVPPDAELKERSIAEVLQLAANAGSCALFQDRGGTLHIRPVSYDRTDYRIDQDNSYQNAELALTKQLKEVNVNDGAAVAPCAAAGEVQPVKNELIPATQAMAVATHTVSYLKNRRLLTGALRIDPRLDALDTVTVQNQFAESAVLVTMVEFTYNGAFRGTYEGRVMGSA